jgi:uncharacterized protein (TIGR00369 family)
VNDVGDSPVVVRITPSLGCSFFNQLPYRFVDPPEGADAAVELDVTDDIRGPGGSVHAGVLALLADIAGAMAVTTRTDRVTATAAVSIHNLAAARVGPLVAKGTMLRAGRTNAVADVQIIDSGASDRLVAAAHVTIAFLPGERYEATAG